MSSTSPSLAAASSSVSTPSARHMRRSVPNWLIRSGCLRALRVLEQERRPAGLDDAVDDLGDLEVGIDLRRDALQLALALEERDPLAEVFRRAATARVSLRTRARTSTASSHAEQAGPSAQAESASRRARSRARFSVRTPRSCSNGSAGDPSSVASDPTAARMPSDACAEPPQPRRPPRQECVGHREEVAGLE